VNVAGGREGIAGGVRRAGLNKGAKGGAAPRMLTERPRERGRARRGAGAPQSGRGKRAGPGKKFLGAEKDMKRRTQVMKRRGGKRTRERKRGRKPGSGVGEVEFAVGRGWEVVFQMGIEEKRGEKKGLRDDGLSFVVEGKEGRGNRQATRGPRAAKIRKRSWGIDKKRVWGQVRGRGHPLR